MVIFVTLHQMQRVDEPFVGRQFFPRSFAFFRSSLKVAKSAAKARTKHNAT
jgi:hypothetical protein